MHKLFLAFLLISMSLGAQAQDCVSVFKPKKQLVATTYLCVDAMQADLLQLHKHILQTHPNPTYYTSTTALIDAFQKAKLSCEKPLTMFEFMLVVNTYLNSLKDSHSGLNPKDFLYKVNANRKVLPFFVTQIEGKFYLYGGHSDSLKAADELLAVDQYPIQTLYELAYALSMCEGAANAAQQEVALDYIEIGRAHV